MLLVINDNVPSFLTGEALLNRHNDHHKEVSAAHLKPQPSRGNPPLIQEGVQILNAVTDRIWPNKNGEKENVPSPSGLPGGGRSEVRESGVHELGKSSCGGTDTLRRKMSDLH